MDNQKSCQKLEKIKRFVPDRKQREFEKELKMVLEEIQNEAYMEGYCYAIQLLKDSMRK